MFFFCIRASLRFSKNQPFVVLGITFPSFLPNWSGRGAFHWCICVPIFLIWLWRISQNFSWSSTFCSVKKKLSCKKIIIFFFSVKKFCQSFRNFMLFIPHKNVHMWSFFFLSWFGFIGKLLQLMCLGTKINKEWNLDYFCSFVLCVKFSL